MPVFESVPNFSEGSRADVIDAITAAARPAFELDVDADPDHNRVVITLAGDRGRLVDGLLSSIGVAVERIDLREHRGVHPRVGAADVVPIVPLGGTTLDSAHDVAREVGERVWADLKVPVFFYGHRASHTLADIRAHRAEPDLGGASLHPTAGAVCIGARRILIAFNVMLFGIDLVGARALARSLREAGDGLRGVQALAFELPGRRIQLSMNLFRVDETAPSDVVAELARRGVSIGAEQVVGLSPAAAANAAADGRLLEGRLAGAAAGEGARRSEARGDEEHLALGERLRREADRLARLRVEEDAILGGAERAAALIPVLRAAGLLDGELESILDVAARGFRSAVSQATESIYRARVEALDARLIRPAG